MQNFYLISLFLISLVNSQWTQEQIDITKPECYKKISSRQINYHVRNFIPYKEQIILPSYDSVLYFLNPETNKVQRQITIYEEYLLFADMINTVQGEFLFVICLTQVILSDYSIRKYDLTFNEVQKFQLTNLGRKFTYSKERKQIFVYGNTNKIQVLDYNLQFKEDLIYHQQEVLAMIVHNDQLISGGVDGKLMLYDFHSKKTFTLNQFKNFIKNLMINELEHSNQIVVTFGNGNIVIFDLDYNKILFEDQKHHKDVDGSCLAQIQHNGQTINVIGTVDNAGFVHFYNQENLESLDKFSIHTNGVRDIHYLGDNHFISTCKDGTVEIWVYGCQDFISEL